MIINEAMLNALSQDAVSSQRRRKNLNFHREDAAVCNRLLNAIEPESYVQPHRHLDGNKDEAVILLRGRLGVLFFSEEGEVAMSAVLDPAKGMYGIDIPHGRIHTLVSLERGTVFFESKAGPYVPIGESERAAWAPREGDKDAAAYLDGLRKLFGS